MTAILWQEFHELVALAQKGDVIEYVWRQIAQVGKLLLRNPSITDEQKTELGQRIEWAEAHFSGPAPEVEIDIPDAPDYKLEFVDDLLVALEIPADLDVLTALKILYDQMSFSQRTNLLTAVRKRRRVVNQEYTGDFVLALEVMRVMTPPDANTPTADRAPQQRGLKYTPASEEVGKQFNLSGKAVRDRLNDFNFPRWQSFKQEHLQKKKKRTK